MLCDKHLKQLAPYNGPQPECNDKITILSCVGAGPLRFGMSIHEVRDAMNCPVRPFLKALDDTMHTDAFPSALVHVSYEPPGVCEAIEFGPTSMPTLHGKRLVGISTAEVQRMLRELDPPTSRRKPEDGVGFTSHTLGVAIYSPFHLEFPMIPLREFSYLSEDTTNDIVTPTRLLI